MNYEVIGVCASTIVLISFLSYRKVLPKAEKFLVKMIKIYCYISFNIV